MKYLGESRVTINTIVLPITPIYNESKRTYREVAEDGPGEGGMHRNMK